MKTKDIPSEHKKTLFYCKGGHKVEQVAERGCGVCICGGTRNLTGCGAGQSAAASTACAVKLD